MNLLKILIHQFGIMKNHLYIGMRFKSIQYSSLQLLSRLLIVPSQCLQGFEQCA